VRIEKRGREWVVVTDLGIIVPGAPAAGYGAYANSRPPNGYGYGPYGGYSNYGGYGEN
jgi:hypothetical protein